MRRVMIVGCPGAGKSSFARELHARTGLPLYYLDMIWHRADRTTLTKEEFDLRLGEIVALDEWIIDGNYGRTMELRMAEADTVFLLDYPTEVCLAGAEERIGRRREDMPWIEESFDPEFRQWILDFEKNKLPEVYRLIEKYKDGRDIFIFRSREDANNYLQNGEKI